MSNILGLRNFIKSDTSSNLIAVYANDMAIFSGGTTFVGQGRNLSSAKMEMDVFVDTLVGVNGTNRNQVFDGSTWFNGGAKTRMPIASYIKTVGTKMYLANLNYISTAFRSRVWFSDDEAASNNELKWGYETGTNLTQTADSKVVKSANAGFKAYNIKSGDLFFITNGSNQGLYHVDTVDSDQQITLVETLTATATGSTYWTGSSWFDVATNDGDFIRGIGENDNKLLIFKRESLYKYDTREVKKVKGAPGTTSQRSVFNVREQTYYFHDTGVYRYDGIVSTLVSRPIQDWIEGIASTFYSSITTWADNDLLYMFVGDITNTPRNISITNGVLIFDTAAQSWDIGSLNDSVTVATVTVESDTRTIYLGTTGDKVLTFNSGNADISAPIPFEAATIFHFPAKAYNIVEYDRVEVHTLDGRGVSVYYKLYGASNIDNNWKSLGDINDDITEIPFPRGTYGRGIAYKFIESSTRKPLTITRIDTFYKPREGRNVVDGDQ